MERFEEVDDEDVDATMLMTADDLDIVMKALDVYAYSLIMSQSTAELERVKRVAHIIIESSPKQELDS
jgi:hypothetical protein